MTKERKPKTEFHLQPSHVKVFNFIEKYTEKNMFAPEVNEISKSTKMSLKHGYRIVDELCRLGYLSKTPYAKRSIKIIKPLTV